MFILFLSCVFLVCCAFISFPLGAVGLLRPVIVGFPGHTILFSRWLCQLLQRCYLLYCFESYIRKQNFMESEAQQDDQVLEVPFGRIGHRIYFYSSWYLKCFILNISAKYNYNGLCIWRFKHVKISRLVCRLDSLYKIVPKLKSSLVYALSFQHYVSRVS